MSFTPQLTVSFALAALLAGCTASSEDRLGTALVAPGGYEFYDCAQLDRQQKTLSARDVELTRLMNKARQGPAGGFISAVTYETDYTSNRASLREVEREKVRKDCGQAAPRTVPGGKTNPAN
ncbi:MAG: hypothetical protein ACR2K5_07045 [Pseudolabrys sp.]